MKIGMLLAHMNIGDVRTIPMALKRTSLDGQTAFKDDQGRFLVRSQGETQDTWRAVTQLPETVSSADLNKEYGWGQHPKTGGVFHGHRSKSLSFSRGEVLSMAHWNKETIVAPAGREDALLRREKETLVNAGRFPSLQMEIKCFAHRAVWNGIPGD